MFDPKKYPYCSSGHQYALDVVNFEITACIYVIGACKRYLNDLERAKDESNWFYFSPDKAERFLRLVQKFKHVKGVWANPYITYEPWQNFIFMNVYGFINKKTNSRRFRTCYIEVARGNGKALPLDTKIPTPNGFIDFGDIKIGQELYSRDGKVCKVVEKNDIHYPEAYKIYLSDNTHQVASGNHLWFVSSKTQRVRKSRHEKKPPLSSRAIRDYESVLTTKKIFETQKIGIESNYSISDSKPVVGSFKNVNNRYITKVEKLDEKIPMFCIEVDSIDNSFLIGENYLPTHNSAIASQVGLYHLSLENPVGNEVYSAATGREQARIILDSSRAMANANPGFCKQTGTDVLAHQILHRKSNSYFKALSSDGKTLDGLQPACALIDELHSHKTDEVYNVIESAMAKRTDSLLFIITTAGFDTTGIGYSQSQYNKKIAIGEVQNDMQFSIIYTIDDKDDPYDKRYWVKANPNMGVSVDEDKIATTAKKAQDDASTNNNFLVKHLNVWIDASAPFFNKDKWIKCGDKNLKLEDFYGQKCFMAVDLANKVDIASLAIAFRKTRYEEFENDLGEMDKKRIHTYYIFTKNYCPEVTIRESKNVNYQNWVKSGDLTSMRGAAIDIGKIEDEFYTLSKKFKMDSGFFDPWNAVQFAQNLIKRRLNMVEFKQNTGNFSEPTKQLDAEIRSDEVIHDGNEVTTWCIGNVVANYDNKDNIFPKKDNPELKIDSAIAIIMAIAGWIQEEETESVYEERGFLFL